MKNELAPHLDTRGPGSRALRVPLSRESCVGGFWSWYPGRCPGLQRCRSYGALCHGSQVRSPHQSGRPRSSTRVWCSPATRAGGSALLAWIYRVLSSNVKP